MRMLEAYNGVCSMKKHVGLKIALILGKNLCLQYFDRKNDLNNKGLGVLLYEVGQFWIDIYLAWWTQTGELHQHLFKNNVKIVMFETMRQTIEIITYTNHY